MKRIVYVILICLLLCGCAGDRSVQKDVWAMDTYMSLQLWGVDAETGAQQITDLIKQLETDWSVTDPDSLIYHPDRAGEQENAFLEQVEALSRRTNGAFDPYMGSLTDAWGFLNQEYRVPDWTEIEEARAVKQLDLGGAVKGYAGQLAVDLLESLNVERALLNLGGNIQTYGKKADGTPWNIGIQNPDGGDPVGVIGVEGTMAVVTSGDYQRYFEQDGKRYHHIIDPATGWPANSDLRSVTVICADGLTADVFSTALFVMGLEEASRFWQENDDFEAVFILTDGRIYATEGVQLSGCEYEVIRREN